MNLFNRELSDENILVQTFQVIAQAIDVSVQIGVDKDTGLKIGDVWALYFWTIGPLENNPKRLKPELYQLLKYAPGSPNMNAQNNRTGTHNHPSKLMFPVHPDDYELFIKVATEINIFLESNCLNITEADLTPNFMEECASGIVKIIKANLPTVYSDLTPTIVFILMLALRSILKDTQRINSRTIEKYRKSGIFHIATMATSWQFSNEGTS